MHISGNTQRINYEMFTQFSSLEYHYKFTSKHFRWNVFRTFALFVPKCTRG